MGCFKSEMRTKEIGSMSFQLRQRIFLQVHGYKFVQFLIEQIVSTTIYSCLMTKMNYEMIIQHWVEEIKNWMI